MHLKPETLGMKIGAFLAALVLILSMVSLSVYAENTDTSGDAPTEQPIENPKDTTTETQQSSEEMVDGEPAAATETVGEPSSLETQEGGAGTLGGGGEGEDPLLLSNVANTPSSPIEQKGVFQTSLYTGSAAYSYLIDVPSGTNGLTPNVALSYNSHAAGGRAGWVGLGWDLTQSYIQRNVNHTPNNLNDDEFNLILNGQSHKLIYVESEDRYHTKTESYLYVEKKSGSTENEKSEYWLVKTKNGVKYRFGYRSDSETICSMRDYVWRWNLDRIEDTQGNHIYYSYQENPVPNDVGAVYPDRIEYNNDKKRVIDFVLEDTDRLDDIIVYDQGCKIRQSRRLKEIKVLAEDEVVQKYLLDYSMNDASTRSLLDSITEYGADSPYHLPPTEFTYREAETGWQRDDSWLNPHITVVGKGVRVADVNGDGLPDMLRGYRFSGGGTAYEAWINTGEGWEEDDSWKPPTYFTYSGRTRAALMDVNGDGLVDIVSKYQGKAWLNTGSGWQQDNSWVPPTYVWSEQGVRVVDVNGDGLPDILRGYSFDRPTFISEAWINTGDGWEEDNSWLPPTYFTWKWGTGSRTGAVPMDVNGDGLVDIVFKYEHKVWLNTGSGWQRDDSWEEPPCALMGEFGRQVSDVNGDGLPDILRGCKADGEIHYNAWVNTGDGWVEDNSWLPPTYFTERDEGRSITNAVLMDANGDGLADILSRGEAWLNTNHNNLFPHLLKQVKTSVGGSIDITYVLSTEFNNPHLGFIYKCVGSVTRDNGMSGPHRSVVTYDYTYSDGHYDYQNREFRGFGYVTVTDPQDTTTEHWFHQDDALKGNEYKIETRDESRNPYTKTEHDWSYTEENGVYETFLDQSNRYTYDGTRANPKTTRTGYEYDEYGNIEETSYEGDVDVSGDERYTHNEYVYNPTQWIMNRVKHTYLMDSDSTKMSEGWYYYDNHNLNDPPTKGDLTKEEFWLDTDTNPVNTYSYDSYGNMIEATDANGYTTGYVYGITDTTHTFPEQMINAKGQEFSYTYDLGTGNLLSSTDPSGYNIFYEYDIFGRLEEEIHPYDSSSHPTTSYSYFLDGVAPESVMVHRREVSGQSNTIDTYTFIDGFGRVIQTRADAEDPAKQIVTDIFYNEIGKIEKQSVPHLDGYSDDYLTFVSNVRNTTFEYDPLGRNIITQNPDGTHRDTIYDHWTVASVDENEHPRVYHLNAYGKITQVDEHNEEDTYSTNYGYNGRYELVKITDNEGNILRFEYDSLGRRTKLIDPDMGTWSYVYDGVGNTVSQTDNKETTVNFEYDELNRITKKDHPTDNDVTYIYDSETIGTLSEIYDSLGSTHYYYDQRLRPTKEEKVIDGRKWTTETRYDAADRVTNRTYPGGEVVEYTFNHQGETETVSGVIDNINYNALSKITRKDYGNGVYTDLTYNEDDFRLNRIHTPGLQNLRYEYDNVGNVVSIEDELEDIDQIFGYDDLDRLISASETSGYSHTYNYNSIGNIINMDDDGNTISFSYGSGAGPHAMTSSADSTSCPDGGIFTCQGIYCCGDVDGICPQDFEGVTCGVVDADCESIICSGGGVRLCGTSYCCGASDGVCPEDFDEVTCSVVDADCESSGCSGGGIRLCGTNYCCGASDGVCPAEYEGVDCTVIDSDCTGILQGFTSCLSNPAYCGEPDGICPNDFEGISCSYDPEC